jgi:hypothetical protein
MSNICEYPSVNFGKKVNTENESVLTNPNSSINMRSSSNGFKETSNQTGMGLTRYNKTTKDKFLVFNRLVEGIIEI